MRTKVKTFAKAFYYALERDAWGDIDPELFLQIATDPQNEWDDDAKSLAKALEKSL